MIKLLEYKYMYELYKSRFIIVKTLQFKNVNLHILV